MSNIRGRVIGPVCVCVCMSVSLCLGNQIMFTDIYDLGMIA